MLIWIVVALGVVAGVPPVLLAAMALIGFQPFLGVTALAMAAVVLRHRRARSDDRAEVKFLRSITSAVSSGSTLRSAIRDGEAAIVDTRTRRLCDAGLPLANIGASLRSALPTNGSAFAAVCSLSERTGSSLAPTLHVLADRADAAAEMQRQRRVASAAARFSAGIVGIAPLAVTIGLVAFRGVPGDGGPFVVIPVVAGATLQLAGIVIVFVLATRSAS